MIVFDAPINLFPSAVSLKVTGVNLTATGLQISLSFLAADGSEVKADSITITGQDFQDVATTKIDATWAGANLMGVFLKVIKMKVKTMRSLSGNVQAGF